MLWKWIMLDVQNERHSVTNKIPDKYHSVNTPHCLTYQWLGRLNSNYWPGWWNVKFTVLKDIYVNTVCTKASDMYNALSNKFFGQMERSILELLRDNPYINWIHIFYKHVLCYTRQSLALMFNECKQNLWFHRHKLQISQHINVSGKHFLVYYIK